mgnify:FL=1
MNQKITDNIQSPDGVPVFQHLGFPDTRKVVISERDGFRTTEWIDQYGVVVDGKVEAIPSITPA